MRMQKIEQVINQVMGNKMSMQVVGRKKPFENNPMEMPRATQPRHSSDIADVRTTRIIARNLLPLLEKSFEKKMIIGRWPCLSIGHVNVS